MSTSVRAWLLLGITLLLGIALGVLGAGALQERRFAHVRDMRRPGGFIEHVEQVIQPTSDAQWAQIRPIVEATAEQNARMRHMHDSAMRAMLDTLRARVNPLLDAQQRERLARFVPGRPGGPGRGAGRGSRDGPPAPP